MIVTSIFSFAICSFLLLSPLVCQLALGKGRNELTGVFEEVRKERSQLISELQIEI